MNMETVTITKKKALHDDVEAYLDAVLDDLKHKRVIKRN